MDRSALSSWLEGPRAAAEAAGVDLGRPGERLGLPVEGRGSVAGFGVRLLALALDWFASLLVVGLVTSNLAYGSAGYSALTLAVFGLEVTVLTWLSGGSAGQRLLGVQVIRVGGGPPGLVRSLARTLLLCLAVPALIWDRDGRGLHDRVAGTVAVRAR